MTDPRPTVLYVCHGHPDARPGGAEVYAWELFLAARAAGRVKPYFLARADGRPSDAPPFAHPQHPDCFLAPFDLRNYDPFSHELRDATVYYRGVGPLVRQLNPAVVHVQHTFGMGYEMLARLREWLPGVKVVYTLHEFHPICHNGGQLFTTHDRTPCRAAAPEACNKCFPDLSPFSFMLRKKHILETLLRNVDLFVAPSRFLRDRFIEWGVPAARVRVEEYGRTAVPAPPADADRPRTRFAFFGQVNPFKGVDVLLRAAALLRENPPAPRPEFRVHGANLEIQPPAFREAFGQLLAAAGERVTFPGPYKRESLPALMAEVDWVIVPSVWWENSPLVIQEAFAAGRPVICSDIGGMAEKVTAGVDGLHFRAGDPAALADTIRTAVATPGLWKKLRAGIKPVHAMDSHLNTLTGWYRELLGGRPC